MNTTLPHIDVWTPERRVHLFPSAPAPAPAVAAPQVRPLAAALARFNAKFNYDLRCPIQERDVRSAAYLAERRGAPEIAQALLIALNEAQEVHS